MDIYLYAGDYGMKLDTGLLKALASLQILQFLDEGNPGLPGIFQIEAGIAENLVPEDCVFGKEGCRKKDCLPCVQKKVARIGRKWKHWSETVETSDSSLLVFAQSLHMLDMGKRVRKVGAMEAAGILWKKKSATNGTGKGIEEKDNI